MRLNLLALFFLGTLFSCSQSKETENTAALIANQEAIIEKYAYNGAHHFDYNFNMYEWQQYLDEGLKQDSTIAYLWQQKAMPYFKARKYEVGMEYIDKAVYHDPKRYQPYRAFIKCIFAKTYRDTIVDFEDCTRKWGDSFEMDHTYSFYIGLSYLQLNEFDKAEAYFKKSMLKHETAFNEVHHNVLFYYGITKYEQRKFDEAISYFDKAIKQYPKFSEAIYYKALSLYKLDLPTEEYASLLEQAATHLKQGYSLGEANEIYESYPYQLKAE